MVNCNGPAKRRAGRKMVCKRNAREHLARVPGVIQETFPAYHGLAWYGRSFVAPDNPTRKGGICCGLKLSTIWRIMG